MPENQNPTLWQIAAGYICAVLGAALTTSIAMMMWDAGAPNPVGVFLISGAFIGTAGLPGFFATVVLARHFSWRGWLPFTLAGGVNALLALGIVGYGFGPLLQNDYELLQVCLRGGIAGGVCYWWAVYGKSWSAARA